MNTFTYLKPEDRDFTGRRNYIGASDMSALAGIDKYKTAYRLYLKLTGDKSVVEDRTEHLEEQASWGHALEPMVIHQFFVRRYGVVLADKWLQSRIKGSAKHKMANGVVVHSFTEALCPQFEHGKAHADCLVEEPAELHRINDDGTMGQYTGETYLIEAKTTSSFNTRGVDKRHGYDFSVTSVEGFPLGVWLQDQWQMLCYKVEKVYTCCLMGGQRWQAFGPAIYAPKIAEKLLAKAQKMWRHVEAKEPVTPGDFSDVCHLFPKTEKNTSTVVSGPIEEEAVAKVLRAAAISAKVKKLEAELEEIKNGLGIELGGHNYLEASDGTKLATQVNSSFEQLDAKLYLTDHPDVDKKYMRTQTRRYILVAKPPKEED